MSILDTTTEPIVINKLYQLAVKIHLVVNNFTKQEKYSIGKRIESALLHCIASACLAAQEQKGFKAQPLCASIAQADVTNLLLRMAHELGLITTAEYQRLGTELIEITSMLGGWLRFSRQQ
ncbi:four helix bundle protein [Patescibacteria group bacterium]|nr:four helix bundle protein [Patescibacteria group bacterium]